MIGIEIDKALTFFDKAFVLQTVDADTRRTLGADGALLRRSMRRSMRRKKGHAPPGKPPYAHKKDKDHPKGPLVYDRTFFAYEPETQSVIVGPELLGDSTVLTTLESTNPFVLPTLEREKNKLNRPYGE